MDKIEINLSNLIYNCKNIKNKFPGYKYYMGVVKSDAYGLGMEAIKKISQEIDYLVVGNIKEAIAIREENIKKPILVLLPINVDEASLFEKYDITATLDNLDILNKIKNCKIKIHLKINTGMNRYGIKFKDELIKIYNEIKKSSLYLEGIYTHLYNASNKIVVDEQVKKFKNMLDAIDCESIKIIHISQSQGLVENRKIDFANGARIGDLMYGICDNDILGFKSTFSLVSKFRIINKVKKGETVGYDGVFKCEKDEYIGVFPLGYSHGITKKQVGTHVFINDKPYKIICNAMNATFVLVDENIKLDDKIYVYKDIKHIMSLSEELNTVPQEFMTIIKNVEKEYIN